MTVGIDMDVTGNGPRTRVGVDTTREDCNRVNNAGTLQFDVFVDEIPADRGISGFEFDLIFDPSLIHVTALDLAQLLDQAGGSVVTPLSNPDPAIDGPDPDATPEGADGSLLVGVIDFGTMGIEPPATPPNGASEIGPGILARITLTGQAGVGIGNLTLQDITITDDEGDPANPIPVDMLLNATVAANTDCPAQPTATPSPTPVATSTATPTPTPTPSPTPTSGPTATPTPTPTPSPTPPPASPTPTPTPTPTPSPTPPPASPTPTPTATPTPTPAANHSDCAGAVVDIVGSDNLVTYDAGSGIATGVCIKSGANMFGGGHSPLITEDAVDLADCYTVTGVGTSAVEVARSGEPSDTCQELSHIDVIVGAPSPTPTPTPTPSPTPTPTPSPTPPPATTTPTAEPTATPTPTGTPTPTSTPAPTPEPTATPTPTSSPTPSPAATATPTPTPVGILGQQEPPDAAAGAGGKSPIGFGSTGALPGPLGEGSGPAILLAALGVAIVAFVLGAALLWRARRRPSAPPEPPPPAAAAAPPPPTPAPPPPAGRQRSRGALTFGIAAVALVTVGGLLLMGASGSRRRS